MFKWLALLNDTAICFVNKWWRPLGYFTLIGAAAVNTIWVPIKTQSGVNLKELAILIAAFAPLAGLRTYEKLKDPNDPLGQDASPNDTDKQ